MAFLDETGLAKVRDWIKGKFVQTVNGQAIDSNGNVNLECRPSTANTDLVFKRKDWSYGYYLPINTTDGWLNIMDYNNLVNKPQAVPVGTIIAFASATAPAGYLPCNGALVSVFAYEALFNVIGTTFGSNGPSMFALPNLDDNRFIEGSSSVGTKNNANVTMPNHYHAFGYNGDNDGSFIATSDLRKYTVASNVGSRHWNGSGGGGYFMSNVPNCNMVTTLETVVETSTTVQPKSLTLRYFIKY